MSDNSASLVDDGLPLVSMKTSNRPLWIFGGVALVSAVALFAALESGRSAREEAATLPAANSAGQVISAPPELAIPQDYQDYQSQTPFAQMTPQPPVAPAAPVQVRMVRPPSNYTPPPMQQLPPFTAPSPPAIPQPAVVYRAPEPRNDNADDGGKPGSAEAVKTGNRTTAAHFANPALTVPQGTVIQAVLETALDSNRAGFARAIISRDVRGFDGSRILIPRGSRLLGNYKADLAQGQNRAFIQWERLMRPDGAIIAVNSPAADPLGRAGVGGTVNTHFFQRFGGALLQSSLDLGVGLASRSLSGGNVVVALPGSAVTNTAKDLVPQDIKPTLKTKQGTSVSVFVARDLDFSTVDQ